MSLPIGAIVLTYPILLYLLFKLLRRLPLLGSSGASLISVLVIFTFFGVLKFSNKLDPVSFKKYPIIEIGITYQSFKNEQLLIHQMMYNEHLFKSINKKQNDGPETHVIIIGESTSRHHMGIYGYWRNTTPLLDENKKELLIFNNVTTPNAHTVPALRNAFSIGNSSGTLMGLLKQAEIESHWISNQAMVGEYETPIYLFANKTNTRTFVNSGGFAKQYDINILPKLKQILTHSTNKRVIFIHLLGTHLSYKERYPKSFNTFYNIPKKHAKNLSILQQAFINEYDNANKYNDFVINSIIEEVKKLDHQATVTYFSDHGDEVYDMRNFHGHSDVLQSHFMTDIPFIFWANAEFKENKPGLIKNLQSSISKQFSLKDFSHFAQDIIGVRCEMYEANSSIANSSYPYISKKATSETPKKTLNNIPKFGIWVHRVNDIERLHEVKDEFSGFEIDIVYNQQEDYFDVNHPPVKSIGLSLKELVYSLEKPNNYNYWLDLKNLNKQNSQSIVKRLIALSNLLGIKQNIIVESTCLSCLEELSKEGFYTAKYLPFYHQMAETKINLLISNLSDSLIPVSAVSQERDALSILNSKFNNCDKLVWDLSLDWNEESSRKKAKEILKDNPSIKVLLVRYETPSYR